MKDQSPFSLSSVERKIDPGRRAARSTKGLLKGDGTADDNDRIEIGPTALAYQEWEALGLTLPNLPELRTYRLGRIREQLKKYDYAGILLYDPLNIRYATDSSNMQLWVTHNPCRACFIATEGPVVLWDFHNCDHLTAHLPLIDEIRYGAGFYYMEAANTIDKRSSAFASEVNDLVRTYGGENRRLAVDKVEISGLKALEKLGLDIKEGQEITELARAIKNDNEINAMRCAIAGCQSAIDDMRAVFQPGITENALWASLHYGNIIRGGEWIETRLLSSGPRTNPWYAECGPRVIQDGELVGFDTDLIGPYGYCADISRTWYCGEGTPTDEQKTLYGVAYDHIMTNMQLLKPGVGFRELTDKAQLLPEQYRDGRYGVMYHGVGLCDEYPCIRYPEDYESSGYDGVLEAGMVLCVEAYVGANGGREGVKLENQVLVTDTGYECLSDYPFEENLLG